MATTNKGKLKEIRAQLAGLPLEITILDIPALKSEYQETGRTFMENARGKCLFYSRHWQGLALGEDSGLVVDALDGEPGIYSARYAGPEASDEENIQKLLRRLKGIPPERRAARFVSAMALAHSGRVLKEMEGVVEGRIASEARGKRGFGYDPVFFYPPLGRTFAELDAGEKNRISHRGRALRALRKHLSDLLLQTR